MTAQRLTIDDVRHHAEEVRDLAKDEVRDIMEIKATRAAIVGVVAVLAVASLAFYVGTRSAVCDCFDD